MMAFLRWFSKRPARLATLLLALFAVVRPASADTVILNNGKKKTGQVIHVGRNSITLQVDEQLQLKLYRAQVKQIITNRTTIFGRDPNAVTFLYNPEAEEGADLPEAAAIDPDHFKVPPPALIHQPEFKVTQTDGGLSDGKTIGIDGKPLTAHKVFARDSDYFARKFRDGMIRTTPPEARDRLALLRFLATEVATVKRLQQDLKTNVMMEGRDRTRTAMLDSHDRFKSEATKYQQTYDRPALQAAEYPLAQLIADLESAVRTYNLSHDLVRFEEQLGIRDRVDLDGGKTERGRLLRQRMKDAIIAMAAKRAALMKKYSYFYTVGQLPEEPQREAPKAWVVVANNALMFPYQVIEGAAAYDGLLEDHEGRQITRAKPLILMEGQMIEFLQERTVDYPATGDQPARTIKVAEIKIPKGDATIVDYHSGKQLPSMDLRGWILADRVALR